MADFFGGGSTEAKDPAGKNIFIRVAMDPRVVLAVRAEGIEEPRVVPQSYACRTETYCHTAYQAGSQHCAKPLAPC